MTARRNGLKEEMEMVLAEVLRAVDFDVEILTEAAPEEIEEIILNAVLSVIDQDEVPFIEWARLVGKEDAEEFKDENGEFILN